MRNPKQIQNSNFQMLKTLCFFCHLNFSHLDLFRASCFGFRIWNQKHLPITLYFITNVSTFLRKSLCFYRIVAGIVLLLCALPCHVLAKVELSLKADTSKKCAICHYQWVPTFFLEHRSTPIAQADEKSLETFSRQMCISCHDASVRDSRSNICNDPGHQVGRVPSKQVSIPPDFPLDENGALKCTTCHTPHAVSEESESMVKYFLRAPNENSVFCRTCHRQKLGGLAKGNHPIDVSAKVKTNIIEQAGGKFGTSRSKQIICETCHRAHGGVNNKRLVLPVENIKTMSVLCEACHTRNAIRPGKASGKTLSHPVDVKPGKGVKIPRAWANGEKVVTGRRGELVCRTCHKPHQADREALLAIPKGKDALCVQCHRSKVYVAGISHDLRVPAPSEKNSSGKTAAKSGPCASCHLVHKDIVAKGNVVSLWAGNDIERSDLERFFRIPHFGLHPRTFFGSAFFKKGGGKADGVFLFTESGNSSDNGTIVCATCHNVRKLGLDTAEGIHSGDGDNSTASFLRPDIAEKFCKACHGEEALVRFLYFHKKW
jgi:predicted CXXCH cytochrome family protein